MDFYTWINDKISDWLKTGRSETQLAKEIGINQATLNAWKNKTRGIPKDTKIIQALISYYKDDPNVYEVLDRPLPNDPRASLLAAGFPPEFIDDLLAAREEYTSELAQKGITQDSPEAREIVKTAFARHGIQLTNTDTE